MAFELSELSDLSLSKGSLHEEMTMSQAAIEDAVLRHEDTISNEHICKGDSLLNTYVVLNDAISGGMGSVWRVHHESWNVDLAMKRPQPRFFAESSVRRKAEFIAECENWINLGLHPNIVSCYYVREIGGVPTIFSEWMDNGSLKDRIRDGSLYQGTEAEVQERILDIAVQTARGLAYSHEKGLIHQDVKPGNILLTKQGEAKVADFGLAKARSQLEDNGSPVSSGYTLEYCPKEQAEGVSPEVWMDFYAWALTVTEMYTGKRFWTTGAEAALDLPYSYEMKVPMGSGMAVLIEKCLSNKTFLKSEEIVRECLDIYKKEIGQRYPRTSPRAVGRSADHMSNCAISFLDLGKKEEALALLEKAVQADSRCLAAVYNSALYKYRNGMIDDRSAVMSVSSLDDYLSLSPEILLSLARIQAECRDPNFSDTLSRLEALDVKIDCSELTRMRDGAEANHLKPFYHYECNEYDHADVSPDGQFLLIHHYMGDEQSEMVTFCRSDDRKPISTFIRKPDNGQPSEVRIRLSQDNSRAYGLYHKDPALYIWQTADGELIGKCVMNKLPGEAIVSFAVDGQGEWMVLGSNYGRVLMFNPDKAQSKDLVLIKGNYCLGITKDGARGLISARDANSILLFGNDGTKSLEVEIRQPIFSSFAIEDTCIIAIGGGEEPVVSLFDSDSGNCIWTVPFPLMHEFSELKGFFSISPDGKRLLLRVNAAYMIFDIPQHRWLYTVTDKIIGYSVNEIFRIQFAGDGNQLYIQSYSRGLTGYRLPDFTTDNPWYLSVVHTTKERLHEENAFIAACESAREALADGNIPAALTHMESAAAIGGGKFRGAEEYLSLISSLRPCCIIVQPGEPVLLDRKHVLPAAVCHLSVSPDNKWLAAFAEDGSMAIVETKTGKVAYCDMNRKYMLRKSVSWKDDTLYALIQNDTDENRLQLNEKGGGSVGIKFAGQSLTQQICGSVLALPLKDADMLPQEELKEFLDRQQPVFPMGKISDFSLLEDGILYRRSDGPVCIFSKESGTKHLLTVGRRCQVSGMAVSPDKKIGLQHAENILELSSSAPSETVFFDTQTGHILKRITGPVLSGLCGFSPDCRWAQTGDILLNLKTGSQIQTGFNSLVSVLFLNHQFSLGLNSKGQLEVIDLPDGSNVQQMNIGEPPASLAINSDGYYLYAGNSRGEILKILLDHKYAEKNSSKNETPEADTFFWENLPSEKYPVPEVSDQIQSQKQKRKGFFKIFKK